MRWMDRSIDKSIRRANTPIRVSTVPGLGELRQLPERWEVALEPMDRLSGREAITLTIDASDDGPTDKQLELARNFCQRYAESEGLIREKLREFFRDMGAPEEYDIVDFNDMSVHIQSPDDETEMILKTPSGL